MLRRWLRPLAAPQRARKCERARLPRLQLARTRQYHGATCRFEHTNNTQTRTHTWKHISLEDEEVKICTEERPHL